MKVDFYFPPSPPEGAREAAAQARDLGYDGFFSAETQYDPFLPLAFAATTAPELEIGTAIAVAFPRSPMVTAMTAWDLARLSRGKFLLGLGTQVRGHITRRFSTEWMSPGPRLKDYIESMRAIWDTWQNAAPLKYEGEFYQFSLMTPFFNPGPIPNPRIPVYVAGVGPYLSKLAGEICQGFHVHPFHTTKYLDQVVLPNMEEGAHGAGRSIDDVERVTTVFVMTGRNESEIEESKAAVRQQISFYASTPSYRPVLEASGWDFGEKLTALSKRGKWDEMPDQVPDEALTEVGVAAPVDQLGKAILDRYGDRVQRVGLYSLGSILDIDPEARRQVVEDLKG
jgi:probable F420-dependent oxidoreductase